MPSIDDVYPTELLAAQDIQESGGKAIAEIESAAEEMVGQTNPSKKVVVKFVGFKKKLALNKTNANKIAEIAGTKDYTQWKGHKVEMYTIVTTFKGQEVNAIRVRAISPPTQPNQSLIQEAMTKQLEQPTPTPANSEEKKDLGQRLDESGK